MWVFLLEEKKALIFFLKFDQIHVGLANSIDTLRQIYSEELDSEFSHELEIFLNLFFGEGF